MAWEMSREMNRAAQLSDELRESEARYRSIYEGAVEGLFRTSVQGKCLMANSAMARMLGYGSAEEVTREMRTRRIKCVRAGRARRYARLLEEQGAVHAYECQFKRKDGTRIWVSLNTRAVRGPDGRVAYFDGFVEEIPSASRERNRCVPVRPVWFRRLRSPGWDSTKWTSTPAKPSLIIASWSCAACRRRRSATGGLLAGPHSCGRPAARAPEEPGSQGGRCRPDADEYRYEHPSRGLLWFHQISHVLSGTRPAQVFAWWV